MVIGNVGGTAWADRGYAPGSPGLAVADWFGKG
jgi:hypothetical protein